MYTNYYEIELKLKHCESFEGNSVSAMYNHRTKIYTVYSYETVIFRHNYYKGETIFFDNTKYSSITSRLQNMLIEVFNLNNGVKKRD